MPFSQYLERGALDQFFGGGEVAQLSTALTAAQAGVTSLATAATNAANTAGTTSHVLAETLTSGDILIVSAYTANAEVFFATGTNTAAATSIGVTSQTSLKAHAVGDVIVRLSTRIIAPATLFVALSTAVATSAVAEPTIGTGNYARVPQENSINAWAAATGVAPATKSNVNTLTFPTSNAAWSTGTTAFQSFAIYDAATGGNLLAQGSISPATDIVNGTGVTISFAATTLQITIN